jgi:molybdate transport system substrate-binding protein
MRRPLAVLVAMVVALAGAALAFSAADDDTRPSVRGAAPMVTLTVSAATSLKRALTDYCDGFARADVRLSFAGSDELAAQIRQGVRPDVFASANTALPQQLFEEGLVLEPRVFAGNRLVLAVPAEGARRPVRSLDDLAADGVTIAVGAESVPVGAYTRTVLGRLPAGQGRAILANVRSNEPDVGGVVGKLAQGAVDAGFVYATDVEAAGGRLRAIALPAALEPTVAYGVAIVKGTRHGAAARAFVDGLVSGSGRAALRAAGFEPPPAAR